MLRNLAAMNIAISTGYAIALIVCFLYVSACASSMELLVAEAQVTGDWSEVEKREKVRSRRQARLNPVMCGGNQVAVCARMGTLGKRTCSCERDARMRTGPQPTVMNGTP